MYDDLETKRDGGYYVGVPPMPLKEKIANILIYKLSIYKLLPWYHGGSLLWCWPTRLWCNRHNKGEWIKNV